METRNDWSLQEIKEIFYRPLLDLIYDAATIHRRNKAYGEVQVSSLISIKTGGCKEDCAYCPQTARYHTDIEVEPLMALEKVKARAEIAKSNGALPSISWVFIRGPITNCAIEKKNKNDPNDGHCSSSEKAIIC